MTRQWKIIVKPNGIVTTEATGFPGEACTWELNQLFKQLQNEGGTSIDVIKREKAHTHTNQQVTRR